MLRSIKPYIILFLLVAIHFDENRIYASIYGLAHTLNDPTPTPSEFSGDLFGFSTSSDNQHVLVGARQDDTYGENVGQAHIFDGTTGQLLRTLDDPTISSNDFFGHSTAIKGAQVLVGAPGDDTFGKDVGQAHLFDTLTGNILFTFDDPTPNPLGEFGNSVAHGGNKVAIGAPNGNSSGESIGQAYTFDTNTGDLLKTFDDPTPPAASLRGGSFGRSVALFGDVLAVGEPGRVGFDSATAGNGEVHIFDAVSGTLLHTLPDPTPTSDTIFGDNYGASIAISSSFVLVGDSGDNTDGTNVGKAHLFDLVTGNLVKTYSDPTVTGGDRFGTSVAIDEQRILIGASNDNTEGVNVGQSHLFDVQSGTLIHTFDDPTLTGNDRFGFSVGFYNDQVLVGACKDSTNGESVGQVHLFAVVPEPSCLPMMVIVGLLISLYRR